MANLYDDEKKKQGIGTAVQSVAASAAHAATAGVQQGQTSYQSLMYQPVKQETWYKGSQPTSGEIIGRIHTIWQTDQAKARTLYDQFTMLQQDKSSPYYAPYQQPTSQAAQELANLGFNTAGGITKDWLRANSDLMNYYRTGTGGTPLAPTKKSSAAENAAYWYYQAAKDEETTEKVEQEWNALQEEVTYWANRQDLNLSDDEILNRIDWKKYKTLDSLDEGKKLGVPVSLNRKTDYSRENLQGVIWAARNNGGSGDATINSVRAATGVGNQYIRDPALKSKLEKTSDQYNPYAVSSTIDDAALYFGVSGFSEDWCERNKEILNGTDETAIKMYRKVYSAEKDTKEAETEAQNLMASLNKYMETCYDPEKVLKRFNFLMDDREAYPTLYKMLSSLEPDQKLLDITRPIAFDRNDIINQINTICENKRKYVEDNTQLSKTITDIGGEYTPQESQAAVTKAKNDALQTVAPAIAETGTEAEQAVMNAGYSADYNTWVETTTQAMLTGDVDPTKLAGESFIRAEQYTVDNYYSVLMGKNNYDQAIAARAAAEKALDENLEKLTKERDEWEASLQKRIEENPEWFAQNSEDMQNEHGYSYTDLLQTMDRMEQGLDVPKNMEDEVRGKIFLYGGGVQGERLAREEFQSHSALHDPEESKRAYIASNTKLQELDDKISEAKQNRSNVLSSYDEAIKSLKPAYDKALEDEKTMERGWKVAMTAKALAGASQEELDAMNAQAMAAMMRSYDENSHDTLKGAQNWVKNAKDDDEKNIARTNLWFVEHKDKYDQIKDSEEYKKANEGTWQTGGGYGTSSAIGVHFLPAHSEQSYKDTKQWLMQQFSASGNNAYNTTTASGRFNLLGALGLDRIPLDALDETGLPFTKQATAFINSISDEDLDMVLYLRERYGDEEAADYIQYRTYEWNKKANETLAEDARAKAEKSPWLASAQSVLDSLGSGAGAIDIALQNATNWAADMGAGGSWKPVDYNTAAMALAKVSSATRQKVQELVDWQVNLFGKDTDLFDFIYGGTMSGIDSLAAGAFGSMGGALLLGSGAAASTMEDMRARGGSDRQVLLGGFLAGAFESVFEKISLGNLFDDTSILAEGGMKNLVAQVFKEAGVNASEEFFTEIADMMSDVFIMGDKNEYVSKYKEYEKKYGTAEAIKRIALEATDQALQAGASGAFMGTFFGAGKGITQYGRANAAEYQSGNYTYTGGQYNNLTEDQFDQQYRQAQEEARGDFGENNIASGEQKLQEMDAARNARAASVEAAVSPLGEASYEGDDSTANVTKRLYALQDAQQEQDVGKKNAAMASALRAGSVDTDTAKAASTALINQYGADGALNLMIDLMTEGVSKGIDQDTVRKMICQASLGNGTAKAALTAVSQQGVNSETFGWLQAAYETDSASQATHADVENAVKENRVAEKTDELLAADEPRAKIEAAQGAVDDAQTNLLNARNQLQEKKRQLDAAKKDYANKKRALATSGHNADENHNNLAKAAIAAGEAVDRAQKDVNSTATNVVGTAEQALAKAKENYSSVVSEEQAKAREQAITEVEAEDQQRAQERQELEAQNALALAEQQAIQDEQSGLTEDKKAQEIAEQAAARTGLKGDDAAALQDRIMKRYEQLKTGRVDTSQSVTSAEAGKLLGRMARKLGTEIRVGDIPVGRGKYENGVITLSNKLTIGQAMVEAALHEVTHAVENTKAYQNYHDFVLNTKYSDPVTLQAAVDQKIAKYKKAGIALDEEGAKKELVAEFARTDLHNKDTVERLVDKGLGGIIRNALHNVNQFLKNMKLTGQERVDAENLRKAERMLQKAINQRKMTDVHPAAAQFSIPQLAQSMGLYFDENTLQLYDRKGGRAIETVTPEMLTNTPIGMMIDLAANGMTAANGTLKFSPTISQETAQAQKQMFADLMSMCAKYKDSDLVWEIASSTLESTFSALKSNSDPQYKTTVDFGTVCAKTQEIINVLSKTMLEKSKRTGNGGLTREDIMKAYNETFNANLTVPCPVCYVFSRWMGVPSLLGQMQQYQKSYVVADENGNIDIAKTQEKADAYVKQALAKYGDAKKINSAKSKIQGKLKKAEETRVALEQTIQINSKEGGDAAKAAEAKKKLDALLKRMVSLDEQLGEVEAYNWVTQALCAQDENKQLMYDENGKVVIDPEFRLTPDEVLFDLNRTGEFAKYTKNWQYRNTRGAGMGKAILPYSGETIGDIIYGVHSGGRWAADQNPFLTLDPQRAANAIKNAVERARVQNLVGGQRLQSTSDFRPEWGLDYMMTFLEMQAIGSKAQMYTKVAEAVDFLASCGGDVNCSVMGKGQGWHIDSNGNYVLDFSDTTGMNYETAVQYKNKYDSVQLILVGMNDTHVRLAIANSDIDFVIPWHSSGNSKDVLASLIGSVGEHLDASVDYTKFQTDMVKGSSIKYKDENGKTIEYTAKGKQTAEEKARWDARVKLLTGEDLTLEERKIIYSDKYLKGLYDRFYGTNADGTPIDPDCYGVKLPKAQANQIFPYEYWVTDPSLPGGTKDTADVNGQRFVEYCESMGLVPRFSQFKDDPGYWKLLIDRKMYDNNGNYRRQQTIDVTKAQIGTLENGKLTGSQLPKETSAKYGSRYSEQEQQAVDNTLAAILPQYDVQGDFSVTDGLTDADVDQFIADQIQDFEDSAPTSAIKIQPYQTQEQMQIIADYLQAVDPNILSMAEASKNGSEEFSRVPLFDVSEKEAEDINRLTGFNVAGYQHNIDTDFFKHVENRHGEFGEADQSMADLNDVARVGWVIQNYDIIELLDGETSGNFKDKNNKPMPLIRYVKKLDGSVYVVEAVGENKNHRLNLVSAYIQKNSSADSSQSNALTEEPHAGIGLGHNVQNDLPSSADLNITQQSEEVNGQNSIGGYLTDADIDQMLVENGLITQEQAETGRSNMPATTGNITIPPNAPGTYSEPGTGPVRQRQFGSQTAQRSDALHDEVKRYLREHSAYNADSNQEQIDRSIEWVRSHASEQDADGYYAAMDEILDPNFNSMSADGQARMLTVMSMAALKGDIASEVRIADAYNQQGTRLGQAMQARKIFNLMTPLGRVSVLKKTVNNLNQRYIDQGKSTRVKLSDETLKKAGEAKTEEEFRDVRKQAYKELADQMPADWKEKLRALRYFSMLFNPVTHIRNVLGNAGFMPAIAFKNTIGTGLESSFRKKIGNAGELRTKALTASKENRTFAAQDAITMRDTLTGQAKYNDTDPVQRERKPFSGLLQTLIDKNSEYLEKEDWFFLRRHYANALAGWMQANGMTPETLRADQTMLNKARSYAVEEAQKATYRDASKFSSMMSEISRKGGVAGFIVDAALPFKKTPTNILKRGIEYSPIGLMKAVLVDSHKLKLYSQWVKNGSQGNMPAKAITPTQYIDRIASGLSGTGIAAIGALMAAMGWLKVGLDDDDEIAKQNGEQEYALKVSLFGQDISYTIDWLAPSSMPLFVGASIYNEIMADRNNEDALDVAADITDSFLRITEPVFNLSMLDGVNSLLQTSSWGDAGNNITDIGATLLSNYATSFVPTVAGKVAKTLDTTRRETFVESGTSKTKALLERTWQKTLAKVPGATYLLKPYVSPLGEEENASTVAAVLQNFISPGYFKTVDISDMEKEMQRLYEATGKTVVVPKQPAKYFQVNGEKLIMNAEQYTKLQKTRGTLAKDLLNKMVNSPEYQIYGDDARVAMIDDAWKYCTEMAKKEVDQNFEPPKWIANAGEDPLNALITRREDAAKSEYIAQHKANLLKALEEEDVDAAQASIEGIKDCGKDEKYVKDFVSDHYRPMYINAMKNDDIDTAMDIQMTLMQIGIGYTKKNFSDWVKNAKKKEEEE